MMDEVVDACHPVEDGNCRLQREQASVRLEGGDRVQREGMWIVAVPVMSAVVKWDGLVEPALDDGKWWDVGE